MLGLTVVMFLSLLYKIFVKLFSIHSEDWETIPKCRIQIQMRMSNLVVLPAKTEIAQLGHCKLSFKILVPFLNLRKCYLIVG